ncbi:MAG: 50S ribosomal protein L21e [Euryarchaeota archaeon]|nr:50S ribosomal protein L21e [Euryarchaeota archaeon]
MKRSRGFRSKTRHKLSKKVREKGVLRLSSILQKFSLGDKAYIILDPSVQKGQPHPRFHGKIGTIIERRGRSYVLEIMDGNARKRVISSPVHLRSRG